MSLSILSRRKNDRKEEDAPRTQEELVRECQRTGHRPWTTSKRWVYEGEGWNTFVGRFFDPFREVTTFHYLDYCSRCLTQTSQAGPPTEECLKSGHLTTITGSNGKVREFDFCLRCFMPVSRQKRKGLLGRISHALIP